MHACGYNGGYEGENIAYGYPTPAQVMQGWINSPGHRANLLMVAYKAIGVGVAQNSDGLLFWVQDFGSRVDAGSHGATANSHGSKPAPRLGPIAKPDHRVV